LRNREAAGVDAEGLEGRQIFFTEDIDGCVEATAWESEVRILRLVGPLDGLS